MYGMWRFPQPVPAPKCLTSTGLADWASDIPSEAFGPSRLPVVTAPSAAHLYCMRLSARHDALSSSAEVGCQCRWWVWQACLMADLADWLTVIHAGHCRQHPAHLLLLQSPSHWSSSLRIRGNSSRKLTMQSTICASPSQRTGTLKLITCVKRWSICARRWSCCVSW